MHELRTQRGRLHASSSEPHGRAHAPDLCVHKVPTQVAVLIFSVIRRRWNPQQWLGWQIRWAAQKAHGWVDSLQSAGHGRLTSLATTTK